MVTDANDRSTETTAGSDTSTRRRAFLKATGGMALAASVAGCVGGVTGGGGGGGGVGDTVKIGVLAPEPAKNPIGTSIAQSAKLAAKQLNNNNGIAGADVEVVVKDTHENQAEGRKKYQELTLDENVDMTTGIFTSEVLLGVLDDIAEQQKVHMTTGAATPKASAQVNNDYEKYKYHFRTGPINAHHLGVNMVDFGKAKFSELGWESVAVLVEDYEWTKPVSAVLDKQLPNLDVDIAMRNRYASGTENFTPIFDKIGSSGADAAFIAMAHTGTPAVVQWAKQQRPFEFGGIHVPMQLPSYYESVEGACNYGVTQNSATPKSKVTKKTVPYAEAYNKANNGYPVYTGYITFDAVKQYASVVQEAESTAAEDVISGLEGSSYTGTAGTLEYYGKNNQFAHDVKYGKNAVWPVFQQWQEGNNGGSQEVIFPDNLATAKYQKPPWVKG